MPEVPDTIRMNFTIPRTLSNKLDTLIPWGVKATIVRNALEMIVDVLEKHGNAALGPLIAAQFELKLKTDSVLIGDKHE